MLSLAELVAKLRSHAAARPLVDVVNEIKSTLKQNIKVRAESAAEDTSPQQVRIQLTADRNRANFSNTHAAQYNGVIIEYPSLRVIAQQMPMFNPKARLKSVKLSNYDVYEIIDGTIVMLYWYANKWCLATTNGYDVGDYTWLGNTSYFAAITELAAKYPNFSFDALDKTKCYTIGFHHPDFHPLHGDPAKLWLVQVWRPTDDGLMVAEDVDIGLPKQRPIEVKSINFLLKENEKAIARYFNSPPQNIRTEYGYFLRAKEPTPNGDILLESNLLRRIRQQIYNLPKPNKSNIKLTTSERRTRYITLRAYLMSHKPQFLAMFPQFAGTFKKYDTQFADLEKRVVTALRNRQVRDNVMKAISDSTSRPVDRLTALILRGLESCVKVNALDHVGTSIVHDYMMHIDLLHKYYDLLQE